MIPPLKPRCCGKSIITVGELPTSFVESMSYYEALCFMAKKFNELIFVFNNLIEGAINEYIDKRFNDIMLDTMYEADTETLILYLRDNKEP